MTSLINLFKLSSSKKKSDEEIVESSTDSENSFESIEEIFNTPLPKNQRLTEVIEASQTLKIYYSIFSEYTGSREMKVSEFNQLQQTFHEDSVNFQKYARELQQYIIINENQPTIEDCVYLADIPLIKMKIEKLHFMIKQIETALSEVYISNMEKTSDNYLVYKYLM